jgi:hypothetical protein
MTRPENRVVRQQEDLFTKGSAKFSPGGSWKIHPTYTPHKEGIA